MRAPAGSGRIAPLSERLVELDSLRGLAALYIVLAHIPRWNASLYDVAALRNGNVMVEIFFVLSGFIIYRLYAERLSTWRENLRFFALRLSRIYPVHLLFLLIYLGVEVARWVTGFVGADGPAFGRNSPTAFVEHLLLVQAWGFFGNHGASFNVASWSISTELFAYLLMGAFGALLPRRARLGAFMVVGAVCLAALLPHFAAYDQLLRCLAGFSVGCVVCGASCALARREVVLPSAFGFAVFAGIGVYLGVKPPFRDAVYLWIFLLSALLVLAAVRAAPEGAFRRLLRSAPLVRLGLMSYSVYMSHLFVILVIDRMARSSRLGWLQSSAAEGGNGLAVSLALIFSVVAATLLLAAVVFRWVEEPARQWVRGRVRPPPGQPASVPVGQTPAASSVI